MTDLGDTAPPLAPYDLQAPPKMLVRLEDPLLNLIGRRGLPIRCNLHPRAWIEPEGCRACRTIKRERVDRRAWTADIGAELRAALAAAAAGRDWPWAPERPVLLAVRGPAAEGWCGLELVDRRDVPVFLCCQPDTHTGACADFDGAATFDGTTYHAERGSHHERSR